SVVYKTYATNIFEVKCLGLKQLKASYIKLLAQISNSNQVFSELASLEQPLFNDWLRGWEVAQAAALKSTARPQNTIKLNCAMNDSFFFYLFFYRGLFLVP